MCRSRSYIEGVKRGSEGAATAGSACGPYNATCGFKCDLLVERQWLPDKCVIAVNQEKRIDLKEGKLNKLQQNGRLGV